MQTIVIIGGGFAGVWSALSAAAALRASDRASDSRITLVSRDAYLTIRPRLYESNLDEVRVLLDDALAGSNVDRIEGHVVTIDTATRTTTVRTSSGSHPLAYDRLILAAGSHLNRPSIPGLAENAFSVDTFEDARALGEHLATLRDLDVPAGRYRAVVVGAGFTGIETATELVGRLRSTAARARSLEQPEVVLVERSNLVAPDLGSNPRPVIDAALAQLGVRVRLETSVAAVHADGMLLDDGEWIPAATTLWTVGLRANRLTEQLPVPRDDLGRVAVDEFLRVRGLDGVFAAGDVARALPDGIHVAPMSCQFAIPMGERAGHNAVASLLGKSPMPFSETEYVTCLDLGAAGALFTQGWDRQVRLTGFWAKAMKETINTRQIHPPMTAVSGRVSRSALAPAA